MRPAEPTCAWCDRPADVRIEEPPHPDVTICVRCFAYYSDPQLDARCPQCGQDECICPEPCSECGQVYPCACRNYVDPYDYDYTEENVE